MTAFYFGPAGGYFGRSKLKHRVNEQSIVHLKHRDLEYDFLILATGIRYNYFGHDEWRQSAPGLESLDDADVIRSKILFAFERAEAIASTP